MADQEGVQSGSSLRGAQGRAPSSAPEILRRAADLIEQPGAWMQHDFWRTANGETYEKVIDDDGGFDDAEPVCFCAYGAIAYVQGLIDPNLGDTGPLEPFLGAAIKRSQPFALATWNDTKGRTQAEVVAALRHAADLAEQFTGAS